MAPPCVDQSKTGASEIRRPRLRRELDFWTVDDEFYRFSVDQLAEADTLLFGRVTYEGMAAYRTTSATS